MIKILQKKLEVEDLFTNEKLNPNKYMPKEEVIEHLDAVRVYVKDTLFDLEATRRENLYLKKLLQERGK